MNVGERREYCSRVMVHDGRMYVDRYKSDPGLSIDQGMFKTGESHLLPIGARRRMCSVVSTHPLLGAWCRCASRTLLW